MPHRPPLAAPVRRPAPFVLLPAVPLAVPLGALAALAGLGALVLARWAPLVSWDGTVSASARDYGLAHPGWVAVLRVLTDIAATVPALVIGLALAAGLLIFRRYLEAAASAAVTVLVASAWGVAHAALHRPRPVDGFVSPGSNGFPSGHTANATALAMLVALLLWPRLGRGGRVLVVTVAVLVAGFIGMTRVALVAHWPSDVIGGWLLGVFVTSLCVVGVRLLLGRAR